MKNGKFLIRQPKTKSSEVKQPETTKVNKDSRVYNIYGSPL